MKEMKHWLDNIINDFNNGELMLKIKGSIITSIEPLEMIKDAYYIFVNGRVEHILHTDDDRVYAEKDSNMYSEKHFNVNDLQMYRLEK